MPCCNICVLKLTILPDFLAEQNDLLFLANNKCPLVIQLNTKNNGFSFNLRVLFKDYFELHCLVSKYELSWISTLHHIHSLSCTLLSFPISSKWYHYTVLNRIINSIFYMYHSPISQVPISSWVYKLGKQKNFLKDFLQGKKSRENRTRTVKRLSL